MGVGSNAQQYHTNQIHYVTATVTFADAGTAVEIGNPIPQNATIIKALSGAHVSTAFNGGGADTLDIGYAAYTKSGGDASAADANAFATALDISSAGMKIADETPVHLFTGTGGADTDKAGLQVTATYTDASSDSTAGSAEVVVAYFVRNDGN